MAPWLASPSPEVREARSYLVTPTVRQAIYTGERPGHDQTSNDSTRRVLGRRAPRGERAKTRGVFAGRTAGRDRDHRPADFDAVSGAAIGPADCRADEVRQQPSSARPGVSDVHEQQPRLAARLVGVARLSGRLVAGGQPGAGLDRKSVAEGKRDDVGCQR